MLKRIEIQNFKRIQDEEIKVAKFKPPAGQEKEYCKKEDGKWYKKKPLILENLAQVNYLVGENGCGKSSVLERIHDGSLYNAYTLEAIFNDGIKRNARSKENQGAFDPDVFTSFGFDLNLVDFPEIKNPEQGRSDLDLGAVILHNYDHVIDISTYKELATAIGVGTNNSFSKLDSLIQTQKSFEMAKNLFKEKFNQDLTSGAYGSGSVEPVFGPEIKYSIDNSEVQLNKLSSGFKALLIILNQIDSILQANFKTIPDPNKYPTRLIFIEEPENHLHPKWQKEIPKLIHDRIKKENKEIQKRLRFFITTHSPFIISAAMELKDQKVYHLQGGQAIDSNGWDKARFEEQKIETLYNITNSLGMYPSDLLFANKMIWVEGPTDAIYIEFWLKKYIEEFGEQDDLKKLQKGLDYDFGLFGGATAQNFYLLKDDYEFDFDENNQVFNLHKLHPQSFVVVDNDGGSLSEHKISGGNSGFESFKQLVIDNFDENRYWYDPDPKVFTIEMYRKGAKKETKKTKKKSEIYVSGCSDKKSAALNYCKRYEAKGKTFSQITQNNCKEFIKRIYDFISS